MGEAVVPAHNWRWIFLRTNRRLSNYHLYISRLPKKENRGKSNERTPLYKEYKSVPRQILKLVYEGCCRLKRLIELLHFENDEGNDFLK